MRASVERAFGGTSGSAALPDSEAAECEGISERADVGHRSSIQASLA